MIVHFVLSILLTILAAVSADLTKPDEQALLAFSSNKGEKTYYEFRFIAENTISQEATIEVVFPQDFDYVCFPSKPECFVLQGSAQSSYTEVSCSISRSGVVLINVGSLLGEEQVTVIIGQVTNPLHADSTSQFRVRTYSRDVLIDTNDQFGFVSFASAPNLMSKGAVYKLSNDRISEGSSWEFRFTPSSSYSSGNSLRFTFPDGFTSKQVLCDVNTISGAQPDASVEFNQRIVTCEDVKKTLLGGEEIVKIINMKNPDFSGIMSGFVIEILQSRSTVVLEKITFPGDIIISPGEAAISYSSSDQFRLSNSTYSFFINLVNPVPYGGKLFLNFTNEWTIYNPNCTIVDGFVAHNKEPITCRKIHNVQAYVIENFQKIDNSKRIVLSVNIQTPSLANEYPITVSSYNSQRGAVVDANTVMATVNNTYGQTSRFVAHALLQPTLAAAGKCGSLEMSFFLKTFLPKSDIDSYGKFRVDIFPQVPIPSPGTYGPVQCSFYGDKISANSCDDTAHSIFDTDSTRLKMYIYTPKAYSYQKSEVPITVTTTGKNQQYCSGFVLDPLVQRYLFHVHIWSRQNTGINLPDADASPDILSTIPDEVYFTEYIPSPRIINGPNDPDILSSVLPNKPTYPTVPTLTASSLGKEASSFTFLEITYTHQDSCVKDYLLRAPNTRNYIIKVFFKQGWDTTLGYTTSTTDKIIKNYPCLLKGSLIDPVDSTAAYSQCDLYIGSIDYPPYLQVNNIPTLLFDVGNFIYIGIPRIQITSTVGAAAIIWIDVLEETPGYWDPTVPIYRTQNMTLFTTVAASSVSTGTMTFTPSTTVLNAIPTFTIQFPQSTTAISAAAIQWDVSLPISFAEVTCTGSSGATKCVKFGYPVYWIYITGVGVQATTVNIILPTSTSVNPAHQLTFTMTQQSWNSGTNLIANKNSLTYSYLPMTMTSTFSALLPAASYQYQGYVSSHTMTFTLVQPVPDNWYLQFDFTGSITVVNNDQFMLVQSGMVGLDNRGILYTFSGSTFILYNIQGLPAGTSITVTLSLTLPTSTSCVASVTISTEYVLGSSNYRVNKAIQTHADSTFTLTPKTMTKFKIMNPIIQTMDPPEGYTGPFDFVFTPSYNIPIGGTLTMYWKKKTASVPGFDFLMNTQYPTQIVTIVCTINKYVHPCTSSKADPNFLIVVLSPNIPITSGSQYSITITTDTAKNYDGIVFPAVSNYYQFRLISSYPASYTTYIFIRPVDFYGVTLTFAHSTAAQPNILELEFTPTKTVSSYSTGGRIQLSFPVYQDSRAVFNQYLGLGTNDPGCWFYPSITLEATATKLQCLLTPGGDGVTGYQDGHYAIIDIINFDSFVAGTTYKFMIGGVVNPPVAVTQFRMTLMTKQITPATNVVTYLNSQIIFVMLIQTPYVTNTQTNQVTFANSVQDTTQDITHSIKYTSAAITPTDYFITDWTTTPTQLIGLVRNTVGFNVGNMDSCDLTVFTQCILMEEIKWIIWKLVATLPAGTTLSAPIPVYTLPLMIQRAVTQFHSHVIISGKYVGYITENIAITAWDSLRSAPTAASMSFVYPSQYYQKNRKKAEIMISFTTSRDLYASGSIEIVFKTGYVPYNHCRSAVPSGSQLFSIAGNNIGEIGCQVQSNSWYITGFQLLAKNSIVMIMGDVDLPAAPLTFDIYTYGTRDTTSINTNGLTIEYLTGITCSAITSDATFSFNKDMFYQQSEPLRPGHVGEFRMMFNYATSFTDTIDVMFSRYKHISGSTTSADGFQPLAAGARVIGYLIKVSDGSISPLSYSGIDTQPSYINYSFILPIPLTAGTDYIMVVTTQSLDSSIPDGIVFPTTEGVFTVTIWTATTGNFMHTEYVEVYGAPFTALTFTSTNNQKGENNLLFLTFQPSYAISTSSLLVLEFNTMLLDSLNLFDQKLGYSIKTHQQIPVDFISGVSSGQCYLYNGFTTNSVAARIICTGFTVSTATTVEMFLTVKNPVSVPDDTYVPIFIYTLDTSTSGEYAKKNWQIIDQDYLVFASSVQSTSAVTPTRSTDDQGVSGIIFTFPLPVSADIGDYLIVNANFTGVPAVSTKTSVTCTSGTFYLLGQNKKLVCIFTAAVAASTNIDFTTSGSDQFYNPFTVLTISELQLSGVLSYQSDPTKQDYIIPCNPMNQLNAPATTPTFITVANPIFVQTNVINQFTDFIFSITSTNLDQVKYLRVTHGITGATLDTSKVECQMASGSDIEISNCYHDGSTYFLTISSPTVATSKTITFITKNMPLATPSSSAAATFSPVIKLYNSQSVLLLTAAITPSTISLFADPDSSITSSTITPFNSDEVSFSQSRYFDFIPFFISNGGTQTGPISFQYSCQQAQSTGTTITFKFPTFLTAVNNAVQAIYSTTVEFNKYILICKMNGVIFSGCTFASGLFTITLPSAMSLNTIYTFYFNVVDQSSYPSLQGFYYANTASTDSTVGFVTIQTTSKKFQTDLIYFSTNQALYGNSITVSGSSIESIHPGADSPNLLTINLTINTSSVTLLIFEFQYASSTGSSLYSSTTMGYTSRFPCTGGTSTTAPPRCWIQPGAVDSSSKLSQPIRIFMSKFSYTSGSVFSIYLMVTNPIVDADMILKIHALDGTAETQQTMSGYIRFNKVLRSVSLPSSTTQSITQSTPQNTGSTTYTLPRQGTSNLMILLPLSSCSFTGVTTTQLGMLIYQQPVSNNLYKVILDTTGAATSISLTTAFCSQPTNIQYFETDTSTSLYNNLGQITSSTISTSAATSGLSLVSSRTHFYSMSSYIGAQGVITFSISTTILMQQTLTLTVTISSGITITDCAARSGFFSAASVDISISLVTCVVSSSTTFVLSNFNKLDSSVNQEIQLVYTTDSSVSSDPNIDLQLEAYPSMVLITQTLTLGYGIVQTTSPLATNLFPLQQQGTTSTYSIAISITPINPITIDSGSSIMTLTVVLAFFDEFQTPSVFLNAVCSSTPITISSATARVFQNGLCTSSGSGVVMLTFDAVDDSAYFTSSDTLTFTLTIDTVNDLQVTSPYNYRSQFYYVQVTAYSDSSTTNQSFQQIQLNPSSGSLCSSFTATSITISSSSLTEIQFSFSTNLEISSTNGDFLTIEFAAPTAFPIDIISAIASTTLKAQIDCLCYTSTATQLSNIFCYRHYAQSQSGQSILSIHGLSLSASSSVNCFIPQILTPSSVADNSGSAYLTLYNGPMFKPNQASSIGSTAESTSTGDTFGVLTSSSPTITVSSTTAALVYSSSPTSLTLTSSGASFNSQTYFYVLFDLQSPTSYILSSSSACSGDLSICRVYKTLVNLLVIKKTSGTSISVTLSQSTLKSLTYSSITNKLPHKFIYIRSGQSLNPSNYVFSSVSDPSSVLTPTVTTTSLYPLANSLFSPFIFTYTPPAAFTFTTKSAIKITPNTYLLSTCQAYTTAYQFTCSVTSNSAIILINVALPASTAISIAFTGTMTESTTTSFTSYYYTSYTSSTDFSRSGAMSFSISVSSASALNNAASIVPFRLNQFHPVIQIAALTSYAPIRLSISHTADISTSFSSLKLYLQSSNLLSDSTSSASSTSKIIDCYYKELDTYGSFRILPADTCTLLYDSANSYNIITAGLPLKGDLSTDKFIIGTKYELIITSNTFTTTPGVKMSANEIIPAKLLVSSSSLFYSETLFSFMPNPTSFTLSKFLYTTSTKSTDTSIYFEITAPSVAAYPSQYLEIILVDLATVAFTSLSSTGSSIPCWVNGVTAPASFVLSPFCVVNIRTNDLVIKVLSTNAFSGLLKIAIDDIRLPASASTITYFSMKIQAIGIDASAFKRPYILANRYISYMFQLTDPVAISLASPAITLTDSNIGSSSVTMQFQNTYTNPLSYNSGNWYPSKVKIRAIGGYFAMPQNPMTASQFLEKIGYTYVLLWQNPNSNTIYAQMNSGVTSIQPAITGLVNPNLSTKAVFESGPPTLTYWFYNSYVNTATYTPVIPTLLSYYSVQTTSLSISTSSIGFYYAPNTIFWFQITIPVSDQPIIFSGTKGSDYTTLTLQSSTGNGITAFYDCFFASNTGIMNQVGCEVQSSDTIVLANIVSATATSWNIYVKAKIANPSQQYNFALTQFFYSIATGWSSLVVWSFTSTSTSISGYQSAYVEPANAIAPVNKYFYNYFERQIKFLKPSFAYVHEANFQFTPDATMAASSVISFTLSDYTTTIIDPGTKKLFCVIIKQLGSVTYRIGRRITCSYSAGVFTFTLQASLPFGSTYLINMRLDKSETGYLAAVSSSPQSQYLTIQMNSQTNIEILGLKDSFSKLVFTQNSFTATSYDYFKIDVTPSIAIPAGTSASESILYVELQYGQYPYDAGLIALYNTDTTPFYNGQISDFKSPSSSLTTAVNIAQLGNAALSQNFRFSIVNFSNLAAGSSITLKIPMITNGALNYQVMIRIRTVVYLSAAPTTRVTLNEELFIRNNLFVANVGTCSYYGSSILFPSSNVLQTGSAQIRIQLQSATVLPGDIVVFKPIATTAYDYKNWNGKTVTGFSLVEQFSASNIIIMWSSTTFNPNIDFTVPGFTSFDEAIQFKFAFAYTSYNQDSSTATCTLSSFITNFPSYTSSYYTGASATVSDTTSNNQNSNSVVTLVFKTRKLIVGSSIRISSSNMYFSNHFIHKISANSAQLLPNTNDGVQIVVTSTDTILTITGYAQIAAGTQLTIVVGFRENAATNTPFIYTAYGPSGRLIESFQVGSSVTYYSQYYFQTFSTAFKRVQLMQPGNWGPIQFNFQTLTNSVNFAVSTNHLELTVPTDFTVASGGKQAIEYEKTTDINWIYPAISSFATSPSTISIKPPATIFDMSNSYEYQAVAYSYLSASNNNGFQYPASVGYYPFYLSEYETAVAAEYQYNYFRMDPAIDDYLLELQSISTQAGDWTVIRFKWVVQVTAVAGDEIWIEFPTNGYGYNDAGTYLNGEIVFEQDLGKTGQIFPTLDCVEGGSSTLISNTKLFCDIIQYGDNTTLPPNNIPTIVRVKITKAISSGTTVEFLVAGLRNPLYNIRRAVLTISLRKAIIQPFFSGNDRYPSQISKNEYTTSSGTSYFTIYSGASTVTYLPSGTLSGSFSATGIVWDTAKVHTWNLVSNSYFNNDDWVAVYYTLNNNSQMSTTCTSSSSCYIFPSLGLVIVKVTGATGTSKSMTFTVGNMNNGLFRYGGQFYIQHWSSTGTLLTAYIDTGLYYTYYTTPITVTLKPTLTPQEASIIDNYWLRDFENIAKITIEGSWVFSNIQSFWLEKPYQIYKFDTTHPFCNATLTVPSALRKPYPYRFHCRVTTTSVLLELTTDFPAYSLASQGTYIITIYLGLDILEFGATGLTYAFNFMALALSLAAKNSDYGVTYSQGYITISTYIQPDLRRITFDKSSFEQRKASPGSQVEFYLLVEPRTLLSSYQVDKFIFRIPDQFTYPAVKSLDSCTMIGKTQTVVNECSLKRDHAHTYITVIPDVAYDNKVKIFSLTDAVYQFGAAIWPGDFYNMTIYIYSGSTLLEKQTLNLTRILGYPYTANTVSVNSLTDPLQKGLFYFDAQLKAKDVLPGYNTDAATMYTSLEYTFANADAEFTPDLGTGLSTGDEIPCLANSGITTYAQGKLKCILTLGIDSENLPTINVFGYDLISAGTAYRVFFPLITTLDLNLAANTYQRVRIFYKDINYSAVYYETQSYQSVTTTTASSLTSTVAAVTTSANNQVGQTRDYTFTFALVGTLATTDYLILTFPDDYFDKNGDFSVLTCAGFTIQVYTVSNQIYLQPTSSKSGTINVVLTNLINPAYSQNKAVSIIGQQLSNMKYVALKEFQLNQSLNSPILPCSSFSNAQISASTTVSGQNDVTYTLQFTTGHYIPSNKGAITLTTPSSYIYSLTDMGTTCSLLGFADDAICQIGSSNRVDIFLRSTQVDQAKEYTVVLQHMNAKTLSSASFTITSLFSENIYLQEKICETTVVYPVFTDSGYLDECSIQVQSSILTASTSSLYSFTIQCNAMIRDNSLIQINLAKEYFKANNSTSIKNLDCFSPNPVILRSAKCHIERKGRNYYLSVQLNRFDALTLFQIQIVLINPKEIISTGYSFSADIFSYLMLYAQAVTQTGPNIVIVSNDGAISASQQLTLTNIPRNAGSSSTYIFTVPPLKWTTPGATISSISIDFSNEFASGLGSNIFCGIEATNFLVTEQLSYNQILNLTLNSTNINSNTNSYTSISCSSISRVGLSLDLSSTPSLTLENIWHRLIISGITNPPSFNSSNTFGITYIGSTNNILFSFNSQLIYRITAPPQFMKLSNISTSTPDLRVRSTYLFQAQASTYLPAGKQVLLSVSLPIELYGTVYQLYESLNAECQIAGTKFQTTGDCSIYANQKHLEILSQQVSFASLNSSKSFNLTISSIYNPDTQHSCDVPNSQQYILKLIDVASSDILLQSASSLDDFQTNCATFYAISAQAAVVGPSQILPGLQYSYAISLSNSASNLTITPHSSSTSLKFTPTSITFDDYQSSTQPFTIGIRADTTPGDYQITFSMSQIFSTLSSDTVSATSSSNNTSLILPAQMFRQILPLTITVLQQTNYPSPTISIPDQTILSVGLPLLVQVVISAAPSYTLYLVINIPSAYATFISVSPKSIEIPPGSLSSSFYLTISSAVVPNTYASITLSLTSYLPLAHVLPVTTKYISFTADRTYSSQFKILTIHISDNFSATPTNDKLKSVLYNSTTASVLNLSRIHNLQPTILQLSMVSSSQNSATFRLITSTYGVAYSVISKYGFSSPTVTSIQYQNYIYGIAYISQQQLIYKLDPLTGVLNYQLEITYSNLVAQTNYKLYLYVDSAFGKTALSILSFKTARAHYAHRLTLPLTEIIPCNAVIQGLALALKLSSSRMSCQTNTTELQDLQTSLDNSIMRFPPIKYEIIIQANLINENEDTSSILSSLSTDDSVRSFLKSILTAFNLDSTVLTSKIIDIVPTISSSLSVSSINYNNATFQISLWQQGRVFAELRDLYDLDTANPPVSSQIALGKDENNVPIPNYQYVNVLTDASGYTTIFFDDLNDGTYYYVYVTLADVQSTYPYNLLDDSDVVVLQFQTPFNINLGNYEERLELLSQTHPDLAAALERFLQ